MTKRHDRPYDSILETIGWTPLIRLSRLTEGIRTPVYAKVEFLNPGGSVKDRIGVAIIEEAERRGELRPGGVVVEATSGNTGIGLAIAAALKGYRCIFTMPDKMSQEKVRLLKAFGADVIITPTAVPPDHPEHYVMKAKALVKETPNSIFADQFYNQVNPEAHYQTTGPEIWEQTDGHVTHFVASAGTGGTLSGVGRYLKEKNPSVRIVAGDPEGSIYLEYSKSRTIGESWPYKVEGIGGDKIPTALHFDYIDEFRVVSDADAFHMARRLTREEGLFGGGSSGLNVWLALKVATQVDDPDACVVTMLPDTGERYLTKLYSDEWMKENQFLKTVQTSAGFLISAKEGTAPDLITVAPGATVRQALNLMSTYNVSQLPVIEEGDCVGSVSESSLMSLGISDAGILEHAVHEVMEAPYPVVDAHAPLDELTALLSREPATLVRSNGRLSGIVTRYDLLHHMAGIR